MAVESYRPEPEVHKFWSYVKRSKKWLQSNNITMVKSDKSKAVVIMLRATYVSALHQYIVDTQCQPADTSYTTRLQSRVGRFTRTGLATILGLQNAVVSSPDTPRLFAFAKTHKPGHKLRPVIDKARSPTFILEKRIHHLLQNHLNSYGLTVSDSNALLAKLHKLKLNGNEYLTVFDFVSMFPSIRLEPCFCELRDFFLTTTTDSQRFHSQILELTHLICYSSFFYFDGQTYIQKRGVPMGSPVSGDLCELVVRKLEEKVLLSFQSNILSYMRYVDDILIIWKTKPDIEKVLEAFNKNAYGLTLKLDQESRTEVNYLDVQINTANNNITTTIYRKPTYCPLFIPRNSADPWTYKVSAFRALVSRAYSHCSETSDTYRELKNIKRTASTHGFQQSLIDRLSTMQQSTITTTNTGTIDTQQKRVIVPYEPSLHRIFSKIAKEVNVRLTYKRKQNIFRLLSNAKDKSDDKKAPGVYRIPLNDERFNRRITYIGSTYRSLEARIRDHKYDVSKQKYNTALARYATEPGVSPCWDEATLLHRAFDRHDLRSLEAIEIYRETIKGSCINSDYIPIPQSWKYYLHCHKAQQ
ncbi:uncharacterized protein LOC111639723 [Centruroides sculpturatus]|nr:uncharacterized protein LOC111612916 [Centruroides sculpturatus]XP_023209973.1 uncharacterized protein LOC111612917 [Centruroides sculpturatus]XP_023241429.1 uncharacterized protein LOC111639723 [Centruroides sculpturatus]